MIFKYLLSSLILLFSMISQAQVTELDRLGQMPGGAGYHVNYDSAGQRLFVGCGTSIWIFDVSDTGNYHVIAKRPLLGLVNETDLYGDTLFAAVTHDGLYALNVSEISMPVISHHETNGDTVAYDLWRTGNIIYLANSKCIEVLEYSATNGFEPVTQFGSNNAYCVARRNDHIIVGCQGFPEGTVSLYHTNDLTAPLASWSNNKIWNIQDIQFADSHDNIIYVCGGAENLLFTKSSFFALEFDGASINELDRYFVNGFPGLANACIINMDSKNDTLFLATTAGINSNLETIVPVLDANGLPNDSLEEIAYIRPGLWHFDLALMHGTPYMATSSEWYGVLISDISDLDPTDTIEFLETGGWCEKATVKGDTLWACQRGYGLAAYLIDSLYYEEGFMVQSQILHIFEQFVSDFSFLNDTLIILSTSNIYNLKPWFEGGKPELVTELGLGFIVSVRYLEANTGPRIIAGFSHLIPAPEALLLCDPYSSTLPAPIIDSIQTNSNVMGILNEEDTVYTGIQSNNSFYLAAYKIINDEFVFIDSIASPGEINSISKEGDKIAVSCGFMGAAWYRFTGNELIEEGLIFDWGFSSQGVFLRNDKLYIADKFYGMEVFDVSTPYSPVKVAECQGTMGWGNLFGSNNVTLGEDNSIYLSDFQAGVIVIEPYDIVIDVPEQKSSEKDDEILIYPNPAKNYLIAEIVEGNKSINKLEIFDYSGNKFLEMQGIHSRLISLNLSTYASGVYILKVTDSGNEIKSFKIIKQ